MSVAAIDIGSNSVRLLIVDETGTESFRDVTITGLGRGVEGTARLSDRAVGETLDVMASYRDLIYEYGVTLVGAVATSASRDALNGAEFMDAVAEVIGVRPEIISGEREAELSFFGATAHLSGVPPYLVIDIGGGSTEFVQGSTEPTYALSVDVGSVRLTGRMLSKRPATKDKMSEASDYLDDVLLAVNLPMKPSGAIGVAGTFTSLAAIHLDLERYDRTVVHRTELTLSAISELVEWLSGLTLTETEEIPSLDSMRAPVILAGALIAERSLTMLDISEVTVSEYDLLDGLAASLTP